MLPQSKKSELSSWVVSSFGDPKASDFTGRPPELKAKRTTVSKGFNPESTSKSSSSFRKSCQTTVRLNGRLWVDSYLPNNEDQLAVHKRKYREVRSWLESWSDVNGTIASAVNGQHQGCGGGGRGGGGGLLLTGPAGAGKTATIRLLANQLGYEVREWINRSGVVVYYGQKAFDESQLNTFTDFLLRTGRYSSQIFLSNTPIKKTLILVEDFPTSFVAKANEMHDVLRKFFKTCSCVIVFIVTDSASNATNERTLFPENFRKEVGIDTISFNPVAPTNMVAALKRIAEAESLVVDKENLESLAKSCQGDIRSAINALQFRYDVGVTTLENTKAKGKHSGAKQLGPRRPKKSRSDDTHDEKCALIPFAGRDDSLFLFRILGKILHCKRDTEFPGAFPALPAHLKSNERSPLIVNPEEAFNRSSVSASTFSAFLHQNYSAFFDDVDDASRVVEYLAYADVFLGDWAGLDTLHPYSVSVAARGVMFSRKEKIAGIGFQPLYKPKLFAVQQACRENLRAVQDHFDDQYFRETRCELFSQRIPFLRQYFTSVLSAAQKSMLANGFPLLSGKKYISNQRCDSLADNEAGEQDEGKCAIGVHVEHRPEVEFPIKGPEMSDNNDEEYDIEEYDD